MRATVSLYYDKRRKNPLGFAPVKLLVFYNRKPKYYTIRYHKYPNYERMRDELPERLKFDLKQTIWLNGQDWSRIQRKGSTEPYSTLNDYFNHYLDEARDAILKIQSDEFSFEAFENIFFGRTDSGDILSELETRSNELKTEGRISTSIGYACTKHSLKLFTGKDKIPIKSITVKFLKQYEEWFLQPIITKDSIRYKSKTTVGIYLRNVRAMYRKAIRDGIAPSDSYPFGEGKYQIPTGKNIKKALTQADVKRILNFEVEPGSTEHFCRDLWIFSYLCSGANIKDIARLKYKNIDGDIIVFERAKTAREKRNDPKLIKVAIHKVAGRILDTWGNKPAKPEQYIFPILKLGLTPTDEYKAIYQAVKNTNKYMKRIAGELGLNVNLTTYVARHTYATVLKRSGVSMEYISETLGHSDMKTTKNYLDSFEDDMMKENVNKLL
jgi:integrase